jgi:hypothetical protein
MAAPDALVPRVARLVAAIRHDERLLGTLRARLDDALAARPWPDDAPILYLVAVTLDHY